MPVYHVDETSMPIAMEQVNTFLDTDKPSFVLFHMNGCGPCSQTLPEWKRLENDYSDNELIGIIDVEMSKLNDIHNEKLKDGVIGFPTMRYIKKGVCENYEDCKGIAADRSYDSFKKWIAMKNCHKSNLRKRLNIDMLGGKNHRRSRKMHTKRRKSRIQKRKTVVRRKTGGKRGKKSKKYTMSKKRRYKSVGRRRISHKRFRGGSSSLKNEAEEVASIAIDGLTDTAGVAAIAA